MTKAEFYIKNSDIEKLAYLTGLISQNNPKGCRGFESLYRNYNAG
jgi:hypothetical protein